MDCRRAVDETQRTVIGLKRDRQAARYTAPAGVLIAPQDRSDFEIVQSQVDPLEAAKPESDRCHFWEPAHFLETVKTFTVETEAWGSQKSSRDNTPNEQHDKDVINKNPSPAFAAQPGHLASVG